MRSLKSVIILSILVFSFTNALAQKREKIKGSKFIAITQHEIENFDTMEIYNDIEVHLIASNKPSIEIEADDNLHENVEKVVENNRLILRTTNDVTGAKKFVIRVRYTPSLKLIEMKDDAQLNALQTIEIDNITIKNFDNSRSFLNVKSPMFTLILSDKARAELNYAGENVSLEMSKNTSIKALITSDIFKLDMYQKANATIEGDANKGKIRLDNDATFKGRNIGLVTADVLVETNATAIVNIKESISISASGKSQVEIYGEPTTFTIKKFIDKASLYRK
ncbi:DUF2807 domain-containing protein [Flavobacterium agricola]|uniref:DUF2807 domain-containing protein n=1 Tax=Flavobacterium agricola TaxID=2870839 RepID=A0ABY6LYS5_9FLAO|nr:DUF2807 domain-containing protein [Flavobacterium agricola]UYW00310.1 DUF2807 domain-containing protein [Flavobacterium agricola]